MASSKTHRNKTMKTAATEQAAISFLVPGQLGDIAAAATRGGPAGSQQALPGTVKTSVRVATQRDGGTPVRVTAVPGEDIVALHIEDGPVLLLHPATARDLMLGAAGANATVARSASREGGADIPVPSELSWPGLPNTATTATRGFADIGKALLSGFQVLTGLLKDPAVDLVASQVVKRVDGQVDAGVYALQAAELLPLKSRGQKLAQVPGGAGPLLVFLHGTFVDTESTFKKLWAGHRQGVERLFSHYGGRVYALDHPTLGASPISNARTLVDALPNGATLHLVSHSRGGLVAEVLVRVAGQGGELTASDLAHFKPEGYAAELQALRALAQQIKAKNIRVDRVVRVACPARGTLLASGRLDAYLSVLRWTLQSAGLPVVPALLDFIGEVARRRADPAELPGLAAMIPDTPLLNWLNAAPEPMPGDLRVVAGDLAHGSSLTSWLKVLLADAYYWTDNDVVVQTRSMYGGAQRSGGATFLLDQGPGVTHFSYFANDTTADAVVNALVQDTVPVGFKPIGPLSWAGKEAGGERGIFSEAKTSAPDPNKPAVFVLPGILGSNLKHAGDRIWLSPRLVGGFERLAYQPNGADQVENDGPIGAVYSDLTGYLDATHEVIPFGYDWRRPLTEEAERLARRLTQALDARATSQQPVRILAHSMGGLLARTVQLVAPTVWQRLMAHADARFVMLGTPNGGSWAPMQVLSGDDTFGNALASIGSPFANHQARSQMALMPGFLQLQAGLLDSKLGLAQASTWKKLADEDLAFEEQKNWWHRYAGELMGAAYQWGLPSQAVLDTAVQLRQRLDAQLSGALQENLTKVLLVVGQAKFTPDGFDVGADGLAYLDAQDGGDGRVPLASALLPGVLTYTLDCEHGSLPSKKPAFAAFAELLQRGSTTGLPLLSAAASRSAGTAAAGVTHVRSRPSRKPPSAQPAGDVLQVLSANPFETNTGSGDAPARGKAPALHVRVLNGNLTFVGEPLLVGHYRSLELRGTEYVVDSHLGGSLRTAVAAGLYPEAVGEHRIFVNTQSDPSNPWQMPRPKAAIVIGLGEEGALSAAKLEHAVCQAAKAWAQRAAEALAAELATAPSSSLKGIHIAATLIGSGGIGVAVGDAARAIAQGIQKANHILVMTKSGWPLISELTLVEVYLDRATEAWRGLRVLAGAEPGSFDIAPTIATGTGPLRRQPDSGYRGADYDLISTRTAADNTIEYALDTKRARSEVRGQRTQALLVQKLVQRAATAAKSDPQLGRTLFQLLVPQELVPFLGGKDRLVLQLDKGTAPIPWELLETAADATGNGDSSAGSKGEPWAIRTQLLRKLSTSEPASPVRDTSADADVLVIGEPYIGNADYPPLQGAKAEADAVAQMLQRPGGLRPERVTTLNNSNTYDTIITTLMAKPWRVLHVAGHGVPPQIENGKLSSLGGVVLSDGVFLGPNEIANLPQVPELVFVNCCHLGGHDASQTLRLDSPVAFAAAVADELIRIGVRCVVAAGWAVDDEPAKVFACSFYDTLLKGAPFVQAVTQARKDARRAAPNSKTWAAYQCYGDPDWVLRQGTGDAQSPTPAAAAGGPEFEGIASAVGLALTLETLAVQARYSTASTPERAALKRAETQRKLKAYADRYGALWADVGAVAEAFAVAWDAAGDRDTAIDWFARALRANDASASLRAQEHHGNLRARRAWTQAKNSKPGSAALAAARQALVQALDELLALARMQPTIERWSLCGSAAKRLAQLDLHNGDPKAFETGLGTALAHYSAAEELAARTEHPNLFYPGLNRMAIELVLNLAAKGGAFNSPNSQRVADSLNAQHRSAPDFWSNADLVNLALYGAMASGQLVKQKSTIVKAYAALHRRMQKPGDWASVADQAVFVLNAYGDSSAEKAAMQEVVDQLEGYARVRPGGA
jgi:CHAT domain/Lecithin:cholesterol acyltransferase